MRQGIVVTVLLCIVALAAALTTGFGGLLTAPTPDQAVAEASTIRTESSSNAGAGASIADRQAVMKDALAVARWFELGASRLGIRPTGPGAATVFQVTSAQGADHGSPLLVSPAGGGQSPASIDRQDLTASVDASGAKALAVPAPFISAEPRQHASRASTNYTAALDWYALAANPEDADAQYAIGIAYRDGKVPDSSEAARWLLKASQRGHSLAQIALAKLYIEGNGVERSYPAAYAWLDLAVAGAPLPATRENALTERARLADAMTPQELSDAKQLERAWEAEAAKTATTAPSNAAKL